MSHNTDWDSMEWDEELGDFVQKKSGDDEEILPEAKDSNGNILQNGDAVILVRDLDVKGSQLNLKRGTKIKSIRLTDNPEHIECKVGKSTIVLKTCFLKKG